MRFSGVHRHLLGSVPDWHSKSCHDDPVHHQAGKRRAAKLTSGLVTEARRLGFRRERETGGRKRPVHRLKDDDEPAIVAGVALARIAWAGRRIACALDSVSDAVIQTTPHIVNA
jgi:hypothetical protein